jgi:hypothetical protein
MPCPPAPPAPPRTTAASRARRWHNHLDPGVSKAPWTQNEDDIILEVQQKEGNRWSLMAIRLPGRYAPQWSARVDSSALSSLGFAGPTTRSRTGSTRPSSGSRPTRRTVKMETTLTARTLRRKGPAKRGNSTTRPRLSIRLSKLSATLMPPSANPPSANPRPHAARAASCHRRSRPGTLPPSSNKAPTPTSGRSD